MKTKRAHIKKYIHPKLAKRIKIYFFISALMLGIVIYEILTTQVNPFIAIGIFLGGIIVWFFMARMFQIFWDKKEQLITSRIDTIGWIILWVYMVFSFSRHYLISLFVKAPLVFVITFSLVGWIMIGRFFGMRETVIKILKKQWIL